MCAAMYISKTTNQIKTTARMGKCILRVNVLCMQSMRWPLCIPHGFNHVLCARGPLARMKKPYKSPVVYPLCPILHSVDNPVFLGQTVALNRRKILSPKHIHPKVLLLWVPDISMGLCVVLGVFKWGGPYSFPAPILMPSKIIKGEGLTQAEMDACTKQVTFVSLGPSVVVLYLPW